MVRHEEREIKLERGKKKKRENISVYIFLHNTKQSSIPPATTHVYTSVNCLFSLSLCSSFTVRYKRKFFYCCLSPSIFIWSSCYLCLCFWCVCQIVHQMRERKVFKLWMRQVFSSSTTSPLFHAHLHLPHQNIEREIVCSVNADMHAYEERV